MKPFAPSTIFVVSVREPGLKIRATISELCQPGLILPVSGAYCGAIVLTQPESLAVTSAISMCEGLDLLALARFFPEFGAGCKVEREVPLSEIEAMCAEQSARLAA